MNETKTDTKQPAPATYTPGPGELTADQIRAVYANGGSVMIRGRHCPTINHLPPEIKAAILTPHLENPEDIKAQIAALQAKLKPEENGDAKTAAKPGSK